MWLDHLTLPRLLSVRCATCPQCSRLFSWSEERVRNNFRKSSLMGCTSADTANTARGPAKAGGRESTFGVRNQRLTDLGAESADRCPKRRKTLTHRSRQLRKTIVIFHHFVNSTLREDSAHLCQRLVLKRLPITGVTRPADPPPMAAFSSEAHDFFRVQSS
jgi:hypothetical protein